MNDKDTVQQAREAHLRAQVARRIAQIILQFAVLIAILIATSGRPGWGWMWAYIGVSAALLAVNATILSPELIAERGHPRENVKRWDRVLTALNIVPTLAAPLLAGLDERWNWSPALPVWAHIAGLASLALGQGLFSWSMASNPYFSTMVRIQADRDHAVATGGPYRYVRHPGYVGFIVSQFGLPLALGSLWALLPAAVTTVLLVVRTALEDRTLQQELDGYAEYARRTRYRLLPGVW
jgi:protein-S-isoprenylcysteine O-methyltransferase Ste14